MHRRPSFIATVEEQARYIATDDLEAALRFLEKIDAACAQIADRPLIGRPVIFADLRLAGVRRWPVGHARQHLIFDRVTRASAIEFICVLHASRDVEGWFDEQV